MDWRALALLLLSCGASPSTAVAVEPPPAMAPATVAPQSAVTAPAGSASSAPAALPSADRPAHSDAPPERGHEGKHDQHAHHGKAGYHMDFSEVERFARHFDGKDRDGWQKPAEVVRLLELRAGQVVADIGAGTGYFLPHLSKTVGAQGRVLALDVEPNMVEYMNRRSRQNGFSNIEARVVPPDDPQLPSSSVDHILIVNTWHHIDDRENYAGKLARALRAAGTLLIVDFTLDADQGPPKEHRLSGEQVVKELEGGGFHAEIVRSETLPKQYVVRGSIEKRSATP